MSLPDDEFACVYRTPCIRYRCGFKYQLVRDYRGELALVRPAGDIVHEYIELTRDGLIYIRRGYAWDGPSGPTIDTKNFMRGSLVHDALYQLIREGMLSIDWREAADQELRLICIEDGMSVPRAWWVYAGVRYGGAGACHGDGGKPIKEAP
jgi:hypothetical protein